MLKNPGVRFVSMRSRSKTSRRRNENWIPMYPTIKNSPQIRRSGLNHSYYYCGSTRTDCKTSVDHSTREPSAPPDPYWGHDTPELYISLVNPSPKKKRQPNYPKESSLLPLFFECFLVGHRRSECPERNRVTYDEPYLRWRQSSA